MADNSDVVIGRRLLNCQFVANSSEIQGEGWVSGASIQSGHKVASGILAMVAALFAILSAYLAFLAPFEPSSRAMLAVAMLGCCVGLFVMAFWAHKGSGRALKWTLFVACLMLLLVPLVLLPFAVVLLSCCESWRCWLSQQEQQNKFHPASEIFSSKSSLSEPVFSKQDQAGSLLVLIVGFACFGLGGLVSIIDAVHSTSTGIYLFAGIVVFAYVVANLKAQPLGFITALLCVIFFAALSVKVGGVFIIACVLLAVLLSNNRSSRQV